MKLFSLFLLASACFAQTARFPTAVATTTDLTELTDRAQSTLSASMTSTATSFTVVSATRFAAHQILTIGSEQIKICAVNSNTISVGHASCPNIDGRGFAGTSAASHANASTVSNFVTAYQFKALREEIKAIETSLGANMSNIPVVPNPLPINLGGTNAQTAAAARAALSAAVLGANGDITSLTGLTTPLTVLQGGTGVTATQGNGTKVQLSTGTVTNDHCAEFDANGNVVDSGRTCLALASVTPQDYNFTAQTPGGSLIALGVGQSITLTPCPLGLNGTDAGHLVYLSGGVGAAESTLITGGTCTSGAASGTITVTPTNAHSGAWTLGPATAGWQEAAQAAGANKAVYFSPGTYSLRGSFTAPFDGQTYFGDDPNLVTITQANANNLHRYAITGSKADITFLKLGFDGNFVNQTRTPATISTAIDGTSSVRMKALGNRFHAFGDADPLFLSYPQVISMYSNTDCQIRDNLFLSNFATEIILNGTLGCVVTNNTMGSPNLIDSKAHVNWWDTYGAGMGTFAATAQRITFSNNRMFGSQRSKPLNSYGSLIGVNGSGGPTSFELQIQNNEFYGLGNAIGTVAVTNGSGSIVGTNTAFNIALPSDVGRTFVVDGDATQYRITAVASATGMTVTPVIARATASGLRYKYQNSGDAVAIYNTQGLTMTGNSVYDAGDNAYDIAASGSDATGIGVFSNNKAVRSQNNGLFIGGALFNIVFSNNIFTDNGRGQLTGHQGCIEVSPSNQGQTTAKPMWHLMFDGNICIDDQAAATQLYFFQVDAGDVASIFQNTLTPSNHYFAYAGGGALFNPAITATMQGTMFNNPSIGSTMQFTSVAFADLGGINVGAPANGTVAYCLDCGVTSLYDNTCATGGTGALATRTNSVWSCTMKQASLQGTAIASTAAIAIPASGNVFSVTGTTTITSATTCNAAAAGRKVSLIFAGILTFTDGSNLKLAGNFVTTADDSITIACDGTNWVELSRAVN